MKQTYAVMSIRIQKVTCTDFMDKTNVYTCVPRIDLHYKYYLSFKFESHALMLLASLIICWYTINVLTDNFDIVCWYIILTSIYVSLSNKQIVASCQQKIQGRFV